MEESLAIEFKDLRERCDYLMTYEQQVFYQLAQLLRPEWSEADVFEVTTKLSHTVGQLLSPGVSEDQLRAVASQPAPENKSLSLFLNLRGLKQLLSGISCGLLCALASAVPMGDPTQRLAFLLSVQERFQLWSNAQLESLKSDFDKIPIYQQHSFLMQNLVDAHTSPQVGSAFGYLFSFSAPELSSFKAWIESLDSTTINIVANLFQFPEDFIVKVWSLLCRPLPTLGFLSSSAEGWGGLGSSFNNPFPHMNASDDGSLGDWQRTKKRTAGGTSKHIINLNDSSSGVVSLRLSSSLNAFIPHTKRSMINSISPSAVHEMALPQSGDMSSHFLGSTPTHQPNGFDHMLTASEAPLIPDGLRSSNWAVLPPKLLSEAEDPSSHQGESLASHFSMPAPPSPHAGDELRSASNGISGLTISQELSAANPSASLSSHNASFFPSYTASPQYSQPAEPQAYERLNIVRPTPVTPAVRPQQTQNVGFINGVRLELRITGAPPAKSVYQRILKPYPVVKVIGADKLVNRVLFLKASLWNADGTAQMTCLDGGLQVAAQPTTATFKKLKVLNTSVQKGTLFKLKFQLEVFGEREQALDIHVWSDPMEVVSHTVYLTNPSNSAPTPATVTETIPNSGSPGSRVLVLGSSFIDLDTVRVKFGDTIAHHTFHESGALIAVVPPQPHGSHPRVLVSVSNDGNDYSSTNAAFTYV